MGEREVELLDCKFLSKVVTKEHGTDLALYKVPCHRALVSEQICLWAGLEGQVGDTLKEETVWLADW